MTPTHPLTRILRILIAGMTISWAGLALATYPDKPVGIVVPYAPGGAVDVVARKLAQKLTEQTGQSCEIHRGRATR